MAMTKAGIKLIVKWSEVDFESSYEKTAQFKSFARDYKKMLKDTLLATQYEIEEYSVDHFEINGFLKHRETGKLVYFSTSDVRFSSVDWYKHVLIRTAAHEKDYTGGPNNYTYLANLGTAIEKLYPAEESV